MSRNAIEAAIVGLAIGGLSRAIEIQMSASSPLITILALVAYGGGLWRGMERGR